MTLGRSTSGAIKIKTDGGLRAVSCGCCGCRPITAAQYEFLKTELLVNFTSENEGTPFSPIEGGVSVYSESYDDYTVESVYGFFATDFNLDPSFILYYNAIKTTYNDPDISDVYEGVVTFEWYYDYVYNENFQLIGYKTVAEINLCLSDAVTKKPFTLQIGQVTGNDFSVIGEDKIKILFTPEFIPPTP